MVTRVAVIDRDLCIHEKCGYVCMNVCPPNRMGEECIVIEKNGIYPVIYEDVCIGCALCVKKCPVDCIDIINLAKELDKPIYQYGVNTFRLYGLPLPPASGAVSLVGKNGIGKTTALRLLSQQLAPNFADFSGETEKKKEERLTLDQRRYFAQLKEKTRVSHKPQHVEKVLQVFSGTVKELLEKTSGKKIEELSGILSDFSLGPFLERKIATLSGGELQKLSIAAAYAKEAELYYFDEFTNYLDIEERLRTAIMLKELSERKSVMIAEHDLTIVDYVSQYVCIIYGEENDYGVVSGIKNVRTGLNEYIQGFLKEENVRFREHYLPFHSPQKQEQQAKDMLSYGALRKSFQSFSFTSKEGSIKKGEIVGIVGKNALGKTIFIRMLAGVEDPDSGSSLKVRLSYKPQYLKADDIIVNDLFSSQKLDMLVFEEAKRRLQIGAFMEKKLTTLSGGELQRVALVLALSRESELYLFDEPSAFLDIEQRFQFANLLKKIINDSEKAAFVVDHDIVFVDAISNRLIVFEGESSVRGHASEPLSKRKGMNAFLNSVNITMRRDKDTNRPRINKPGSSLDLEQKKKEDYYYVTV